MRTLPWIGKRLVGPLLGTMLFVGATLALGGCYADEDAYVATGGVGVGVGGPGVQISSVNDFYPLLSPYGSWYDTDLYGDVWCPGGVAAGWSPYSNGQWDYTQYGWTFDGAEPWGWAAYHYGSWANVGSCGGVGWGWIPGVEWGPAWVDWRTWGGYTAWSPMGPQPGRVVHFGPGVAGGGLIPKAVVRPGMVAAGVAAGSPVAGINAGNRWNVVRNGDLGTPNLGSHIGHPGGTLPAPSRFSGGTPVASVDRPGGLGMSGHAGGYGVPMSPGSATRGPSGSYTSPAYGTYSNGGTYRGGYGTHSYGSPSGGTPRSFSSPSYPHFSSPSVGGGYRGSVGGGGFHGGGGGGFHGGGGAGFHGGGGGGFHGGGGGFHGGGAHR